VSDVDQPATAAQDFGAADTWTARHPAATYTLARLVLFVIPFALLLLVSEFFTALLVAFLFSAIVSIFLLRKQREALARSVATRAQRANEKMAERAAAEDAWDDANRVDDADDSDDAAADDATASDRDR
jgi:membrane protein implicated in regulation of membrane protease activity